MTLTRNTIYNLSGSLLPLCISLLVVPPYLRLVGDIRFGALSVAWLITGYFNLFDLGLGRATAQRIAAAREHANEVSNVLWTAIISNAALGLLGGIILWPTAHLLFDTYIKFDSAEIRQELVSGIGWLALAIPLGTISGSLGGALQGKQKFILLNGFNVANSMTTLIAPLVVARVISPELEYLIPAVIISRLFTAIGMLSACWCLIMRHQTPKFSRRIAFELFRFGTWVTVTAVVSPIMTMLDRFLIGALLGARAVTYYTVPYQLAEKTTMVAGALSSAIFPVIVAATPDRRMEIVEQSIHGLVLLLSPAILILQIVISPFFTLWLGPEFSSTSAPVGRILLLSFWINSMAFIPYAFLQAAGKPQLVARCHLVELLPYVTALLVSVRFFGIQGAALVFGLRVLADMLLLLWLSGSLSRTLPIMIIPAFYLGAAAFVVPTLPSAVIPWASLLLLGISATGSWWQTPEWLRAQVLTSVARTVGFN